MSDIEITLFLNEHRFAALEQALTEQDSSVEDYLKESFVDRYESLIPEERREEIETLIQQEEQRQLEAGRQFAVLHFHEEGDDYHFTSELRDGFYSAAHRYQDEIQDKLGRQTLDSLALAFSEHQPIDEITFSVLCDAIEHDRRITAILEFDFDSGIVGVREQNDLQWRAYQLKDVSIAVSKAERLPHLPLAAKEIIFEDALQDREISLRSFEESSSPLQCM